MRRSSFLVVTLAAVFAACGPAPTSADGSTAEPGFTGYTYGSGNKADTAATTSATESSPVADDTVGGARSGYTYGSGN